MRLRVETPGTEPAPRILSTERDNVQRPTIKPGVRRGGIHGLRREYVNLDGQPVFREFETAGVKRKVEIRPHHMLIRNKGVSLISFP